MELSPRGSVSRATGALVSLAFLCLASLARDSKSEVFTGLLGPYELFRFRNTRGQLARRGSDLRFARYHVERADERKEFVAAVKYLLERVPLSCDLDALLRRWRWLAEGSIGCIGNLKTWLVDAVAEGGTRLTVAMLTRIRPNG